MNWTLSASGTQATTVGTETTLATDTSHNATFVASWDISALAAGEQIELRVYTTALSGGTSNLIWKGSYAGGGSVSLVTQSPPVQSDIEIHITVKQLNGSSRSIPWKLAYI